MLRVSSDILVHRDIGAADWARALAGRRPLILAPASDRGWFGGETLVAWDPEDVRGGVTLREAGAELDESFAGDSKVLCAALATYEGDCIVAHYAGGVALAEDGWHAWGAPLPLPATGTLAAASLTAIPDRTVALMSDATGEMGAMAYRSAVREVQERIAAGDVYVLNLTYRVRGTPTVAPPDAFAALLGRARSDFSAYFEPSGSGPIASVSPERFVRVVQDTTARLVEIRPIKGTRPRGATARADVELAQELLRDPKERAEHVMVVDLERNDLGRVCVPGTVRVEPLYEVIQTPYCHQLVSAVRGELRGDVGLGDVLEATFPCGSVTGAPKLAAIRIAEEFERSPRGAYCGALLVAMPGELDSSVLIRTMEYVPAEVSAAAGDAESPTPHPARWGTGGGITAESDPASEWLESVLKASPVMGDALPEVALLETCRVAFGRVPLLDRHLARLTAGGCGPGVLAAVRARVAEALRDFDAGQAYGRLRVLVSASGQVQVAIDSNRSTLEVEGGPVLEPHDVSVAPALPRGAAKPADRTPWDLAHAAAAARGADQAVLVMPDGILVDGSTASVWIRKGRDLLTPPAPPAVDGVGRGLVFDAAHGLGYDAREAKLALADLNGADELFLSNALAGVVAVRGRSGVAASTLAGVFARAWNTERI